MSRTTFGGLIDVENEIGVFLWRGPPQDGEEEEDLEMFAIICPICMSIGCIGLVDVENEYLFDFLFFCAAAAQRFRAQRAHASGLTEPTTPVIGPRCLLGGGQQYRSTTGFFSGFSFHDFFEDLSCQDLASEVDLYRFPLPIFSLPS